MRYVSVNLESQHFVGSSGGPLKILGNPTRTALGIFNKSESAVDVVFGNGPDTAAASLPSGAFWDFYSGTVPISSLKFIPEAGDVNIVLISSVTEVEDN